LHKKTRHGHRSTSGLTRIQVSSYNMLPTASMF
jgi:hypothetical protein